MSINRTKEQSKKKNKPLKGYADSGHGIVDFDCLWVIVVCRVVYRVLKSGFMNNELVCLCLDTLIELQLWNENVC